MECNQDGINIIKKYESLSLVAYRCPAGILTVGYGHTGPDVKPGMLITARMADDLLLDDVAVAEKSVKKLVKSPINSNQFSALVSLFFNVGETKLKDSTLLKKLNSGNYAASASEFLKWNKSKGKVLNGLVKRRKEESELFLKP